MLAEEAATSPWARDRTPAGDLFDLLHRPAWHLAAACRDHPTVDFFPERGADSRPAVAVCAGCPVVDQCRAFAADQGADLVGIWGGMSKRQRTQLRRAG